MEKKAEKIITKLKGAIGDGESLMVAYIDADTMDSTMLLETHNVDLFVSAICNVFDRELYGVGNANGAPFTNLFSMTLITYCKHHPDFASRFIEVFNKAVYGI